MPSAKTSASGMCARSTVMETGNVEIELGEFCDPVTLGCCFVEVENMLRGRHNIFSIFLAD